MQQNFFLADNCGHCTLSVIAFFSGASVASRRAAQESYLEDYWVFQQTRPLALKQLSWSQLAAYGKPGILKIAGVHKLISLIEIVWIQAMY